MNITGGDVTLNSNDTWTGAVNVGSGNLVIDNVTSNGVITAEGNDSTVTLKPVETLISVKVVLLQKQLLLLLKITPLATISDKGGLVFKYR